MRRLAATACALLLPTLIVASAQAQTDPSVPSQVVPVARAPVSIEQCRISNEAPVWPVRVVLGNRTKHGLAAASISFTAYDSENTKLAQRTMDVSIPEIGASGDTAPYLVPLTFLVGEITDAKLVSRISCRIATASFTGNRHWSYPQRWPEALVKLVSDASPAQSIGADEGAAPRGRANRLSLTVANAWTDLVGGTLYVHDSIVIRGADQDRQLRASDVFLDMRLANGGRGTYVALSQPAPTYQKIDPLGSQTATVNEVEPSSDFGRIGTLIVPAHGSVTTTVTFAVSDPVIDKSDDRDVSVK